MIIVNSALHASLAIYHLISNAYSWNNNYYLYLQNDLSSFRVMIQFVVTVPANKLLKGTSGYYKVVFIELNVFIKP